MTRTLSASLSRFKQNRGVPSRRIRRLRWERRLSTASFCASLLVVGLLAMCAALGGVTP